MTPRDRAEKIVERFLSTPEGFAPDDKQALIAAIEQGMNEVLDMASDCLKVESDIWRALAKNEDSDEATASKCRAIAGTLILTQLDIYALKSPDFPRNTITDNQKDEKR